MKTESQKQTVWVEYKDLQCKSCLVSLLPCLSPALPLHWGSVRAAVAWGCSVPRHVRVTPQPRSAVLHLHLRWQTMNESIAVHPNEEGNASTLSGSCVCPSSQSPPCQRRRRGSPALIYITTVAHFNLPCPWSRCEDDSSQANPAFSCMDSSNVKRRNVKRLCLDPTWKRK